MSDSDLLQEIEQLKEEVARLLVESAYDDAPASCYLKLILAKLTKLSSLKSKS